MRTMSPWCLLALLAGAPLTACQPQDADGVDPIAVSDGRGDVPSAPRTDTRGPGAASGQPGGVWVEDAAGLAVGVLIRRGSDDNIASRAIYDLVTVFHPDSGMFFEITMSDGIVRYPATTFFSGFTCDIPIGIAAGACTECAAGYGIGILHGDRWYRVVGGSRFEQMGPGSTRSSGIGGDCVAHGTSNARAFPVVQAAGPTPPTAFTGPLRFAGP